MFTILRIANIAGLGGGLVSAAVFDDRLSGLPRLALFAALGVLNLIMIVWITRKPAQAPATETTVDDSRQIGLETPRAALTPPVEVASDPVMARHAA